MTNLKADDGTSVLPPLLKVTILAPTTLYNGISNLQPNMITIDDGIHTAKYQLNFSFSSIEIVDGVLSVGVDPVDGEVNPTISLLALGVVPAPATVATAATATSLTTADSHSQKGYGVAAGHPGPGPAIIDTVSGGAGDDVFEARSGNHAYAGGGGVNTLVFQSGYQQATIGGTASARTVTTPGGMETLDSIQKIEFVDGRVTYDPTDSAAQVNRLYVAALGRTSDQAGLSYWTAEIDSGADLKSLAKGFLASAEFASRYPAAGGSNSAFVEQLYRNVLHRPSDAEGQRYWQAQLNNGAARSDVLASFSESLENLGNTAQASVDGIWVTDPVAAQLARLYDATFGRSPDAAGLEYWKTSIQQHSQTLKSVAASFVGSAEFAGKYGALNDSDFVGALYTNTLHRAADAPGLSYWASSLSNGTSRGDILASFSESAEHIANTSANITNDTPALYGIKLA